MLSFSLSTDLLDTHYLYHYYIPYCWCIYFLFRPCRPMSRKASSTHCVSNSMMIFTIDQVNAMVVEQAAAAAAAAVSMTSLCPNMFRAACLFCHSIFKLDNCNRISVSSSSILQTLNPTCDNTEPLTFCERVCKLQ